jgi:hypothetical protein
MNVSGTGLSGSQTFTANQSTNATFTVTSNATSANTGSTIVARDASGNFTAGDITATRTGGASGVIYLGTSGTRYLYYDSANYYLNGAELYINGTQAVKNTGTWGISITGNAATATTADQIDSWPFRNTGSNSATAADSLDSNGVTYVATNISLFGQSDGALYSQAYSSSWQHQIFGDYRTGQIAIRGKNSGTWQSWRAVLDATNYGTYVTSLSNLSVTSANITTLTGTTFSDGAGNVRNIPSAGSTKTSPYTLATTDIGEFVTVGSGGSITVPNSTFSAGNAVSIYNDTTGSVSINISVTTAYVAGTNTNRTGVTLATRGLATILFISGTQCVISGNVT